MQTRKPLKNTSRARSRRAFLRSVAIGAGAAGLAGVPAGAASAGEGAKFSDRSASPAPALREAIEYPRVFTGMKRKMISFPLGGIGAGSISLGGRGQLREWWIANRPDKGNAPEYAFPSIWVQSGNLKPVAKVLEARILPPYEGPSGLASANAPGLPRLRTSAFTGEYPLARVDFEDDELPVKVSLEAFTPFIPLDADDSGLPAAILRYSVANPRPRSAKVSIAFSIDNPVGVGPGNAPAGGVGSHGRANVYRESESLQGLLMQNPFLPSSDHAFGSFVLAILGAQPGGVTYLRGWPSARWWQSPLLFWEDFSDDGRLGPESAVRNAVGSLCLQREIPARGRADYTFILSWGFPNRTPARCGWEAPKGHENDLIGNYYAARFKD
ncbi:MAG: hypothetical protein KGM47_00835, partial [Acidobacteriota bacterium]|nr:hypothetical protein [Acidobacteriota bacterium]